MAVIGCWLDEEFGDVARVCIHDCGVGGVGDAEQDGERREGGGSRGSLTEEEEEGGRGYGLHR